MKHVVAVNASPRKSWNTGQLVREAARAAGETGAEVEVVDLYDLEPFMGCRSCFLCKTEKYQGKCVYADSLAPVLEKLRQADAIILGTPNYFGRPTAGFRALYERMLFQYLTYKTDPISYNDRRAPVLFIMTSNAPEQAYGLIGYDKMIEEHAGSLERFVGPVSTFVVADTQQVTPAQYEKFGWSMMDWHAKVDRHDQTWDQELARAFEAGAALMSE